MNWKVFQSVLALAIVVGVPGLSMGGPPSGVEIAHAEPIPKGQIAGEYLQAWLVAYEDFLDIKDLSEQEKELGHYLFHFSQDELYWYISFTPVLPEGKEPRLGQPEFGASVIYWIEKEEVKLAQRLFWD